MVNEIFETVEKVGMDSCCCEEVNSCTTLDKCSGHCISGQEGTLGHHDNREPLY